MTLEMDGLVERMLDLTTRLEKAVSQKDSEPDEWLLLLDERQNLMNQLDGRIQAGEKLSEAQTMLLMHIHEANQRLQPVMLNRKQGVEKKLMEIQRNKVAVDAYHETGPNAYGAFFDSKK
ncbi:flagellar protein FliT [Brevibacillus borstelensis]|uniref:flagellar protein FliT n=1 Tax=Brevibacillus borstelensis TaxID=45462 RepID=UPI00287FA841|nr:flagellar protein FliT [Brevibacillus borstelensis]WNF06284.1 flagellar protein FliT [Brevibacillus borstelensis]